jgi:hypothetical protein
MKTPTLPEFKAWAKDCRPAAKAVLMARVYAEMERERVIADRRDGMVGSAVCVRAVLGASTSTPSASNPFTQERIAMTTQRGHTPGPDTSYTPGPWHVGPHYKTDVESRHGRICECGITRGPQSEANARLVAAAPELLQALKGLAEWCEDNFAGEDSGPGMELNVAYATIAKAEGREG